jgi:hypothetical protein
MLDLQQIAPQVAQFVQVQRQDTPAREAALATAWQRLQQAEAHWVPTLAAIENSKTSWLLAEWREPPNCIYSAPPAPELYTAIATDGSQIVADRHDIALCYVLNIGRVVLRYGTKERTKMTSSPQLYLPEEDVLESPHAEEERISGRRLATQRLMAEIEALAEEIEALPTLPPPIIAFVDGTILLWVLETEMEEFRREILDRFEACLEAGRRRRVPMVGYISAPQSRDVVNSLRVFACDKPRADCDLFCPRRGKPDFEKPVCAGTERITDADLFARHLKVGERSAVFGSRSKILREIAPPHRTTFCYLHTGAEIARLEMPQWVAEDSELLSQVHSLAWDQAQKGAGYPVALTEAHEQAVVRGAERDLFFDLLQRRMVGEHLPTQTTRKALSKRWRRL